MSLKRVLRPIHLWAIAVGLVISGDYFGWNYGLAKGGPVGMIVATLLVSVMYVCFIFSYTELSTAIPHSGGPFAFARRAFGPMGGFVAGYATVIEFVFAPPAIARAIGSYVHFRAPIMPVNVTAIGAFVVFGAVNAFGVSLAATFELFVTALAAFELGLFFFLTAPHVDFTRIVGEPSFGAIPFAIWFYLGMEGIAMSAEEVVDPPRDIPKGYIAGLVTLVVLALGTLICTTGVLPWQELIKDDSPLPKALASVLSPDHPMTHLMVYLGLFGLIASFHGIIMGSSRQLYALGRDAYLPKALGRLNERFGTPIWATVVSCIVGAAAVLSERTDDLITLSVLGAVSVYIVSMLSLFRLRRTEPGLTRPFRAPVYPAFPAIALVLAVLAFVAVAASAPAVTAAFGVLFVVAALVFRGTTFKHLALLLIFVVHCASGPKEPASLPDPELVLLSKSVSGTTATLAFELKNERNTPLRLLTWESDGATGPLQHTVEPGKAARFDVPVPLKRSLGQPAAKVAIKGRILASDDLIFEFEDNVDLPASRVPEITPEVTAQRYDNGRVEAFVVLIVHNPNPFAITMDLVSYRLSLDGEQVAAAELLTKESLQANGRRRLETQSALEAPKRRKLPYVLEATVFVGGKPYPFKKTGDLHF